MQIDVTKYDIGCALSASMLVTKCPACGKGAVEYSTKKKRIFVHTFRVERRVYEGRRSRNHAARGERCELTPAEHERLVRELRS